jgi:hypothetical protein
MEGLLLEVEEYLQRIMTEKEVAQQGGPMIWVTIM